MEEWRKEDGKKLRAFANEGIVGNRKNYKA